MINLSKQIEIPDIEPAYITIKNTVVKYANVDAFIE